MVSSAGHVILMPKSNNCKMPLKNMLTLKNIPAIYSKPQHHYFPRAQEGGINFFLEFAVPPGQNDLPLR